MKKYGAVGLKCPEPLMVLRNGLAESEHGEPIEMVTDDVNAIRTIGDYCKKHNISMRMEIKFIVTK